MASPLILLLGLAPDAARAGAVQLTIGSNVTCPVNNCSAPGSLNPGDSTGGQPFSFTFSDGPDNYAVSGNYSASYLSGTIFTTYLAVTATNAVTNTDTFSFDVLQNFFDNSPGTWAGNYTEAAAGTLASGESLSCNLYYDGSNVGTIGPLTGPMAFNQTMSNNLTGSKFTADTLSADSQFIFTFDAGDPAGTTGGINVATPEPAETIPAAGFYIAGFYWLRTRRSGNSVLELKR
jgi:hypothetical protein